MSLKKLFLMLMNIFTLSLDYQKKIDDCKHKIEMARSEVVSDEEIERLQKELDVQLKREKQLREDLK